MEKFYESYQYIQDLCEARDQHIDNCLSIMVVKVNPKTNSISDREKLNTDVRVWLEFGFMQYDDNFNALVHTHDPRFDCGADTFENAIIRLAKLMKKIVT